MNGEPYNTLASFIYLLPVVTDQGDNVMLF